jgi:outer membrane protein
MKRLGIVVLSFSVVCAMSAARAQSNSSMSTAPAPSNIAVLNFNEAVLGTAEAQRSMGALQKKYAPREQELQELNVDIEAIKKSLNDAAAAKLTDAEKNKMLQDLGTKEKQLQREAEDFKNDSQAESQRTFQQVAQKVFSLLQEFSVQHGYAAVLERGTETAPVVWYTASNVDITGQLIKSYDAKYGVGATGPADKPAPKRTSPFTAPKQP